MKTITTVSQVKTILKITTVAPSQCLHKYRREITFLMACNNVKHCCLSARWSLPSFKHETSIWSRMLLKIIQFWNLFQVCANIDKIKAYMGRCLLVCLIVWVFSMYLYWNSGELKSKTFLMRHIVNSCHVALVQENSLYHDLCLLFVLHWRAAKEIGGNSVSFK